MFNHRARCEQCGSEFEFQPMPFLSTKDWPLLDTSTGLNVVFSARKRAQFVECPECGAVDTDQMPVSSIEEKT